jgi:type II secretory pathway predicted ATPase ExeA
MYLDFYSLSKEPFHITPDPYFFYMSPSHKESYASLIYGLKNKKGFVSLTGEVGLGKTTVIRTFLKNWTEENKVKTVFVFNSNLSFKGLLLHIYSELGLDLPDQLDSRTKTDHTPHALPVEDETFELVRKLHKVLIWQYRDGYNVILVIDDAQNMPVQTLENLRMLSNLETSTDKLLQIFLIGQTELDAILNKQELRQLRQRIAIRATIYPLDDKQTRDYIRHRLKKAGAKQDREDIFTKGALKLIYKYSKGIPRKINIICDNALVTGFGYGRKKINSAIIKEVNADLEGRRISKKFRYALAGSVLLAGLIIAGMGLNHYRENILSGVERFSSWGFSLTSKKIEDHPEGIEALDQAAEVEISKVNPGQVQGSVPARQRDLQRPATAGDQSPDEAEPQDLSSQESTSPSDGQFMPGYVDTHNRLSQIIPVYNELSWTRQQVLIRMARQMPRDVLLNFTRMLAALEQQDYEEAAREMEDSNWARSVGRYASDLAEAMRTDEPNW